MRYKKLLLPMLLFVLLGVGICAGWEFDNVKEYTPTDNYGKIEIVNAFGLGSTLVDHTLLYNTEKCFINCKAGGVSNLYTDGQLFSNLDTYTKDKSKLLGIEELNIYLVVDTVEYENITLTNNVCTLSKTQLPNGSYPNDCEEVNTIQQVENTVTEYVPYNFETLEPGKYNWEIRGKKKSYEAVDWIGETMGISLDEWAAWDKTDCSNRNSFNIEPQVTDANQQLLLNLGYLINTSNTYVVYNTTNTELKWTIKNNTKFNSIILTNRSVTAGVGFGVDVYYNCSTPTQQYNLSDVMLETYRFETQAEVNAFGNVGTGGTWVINSTSMMEGIGSMTGAADGSTKRHTLNNNYTNASVIIYANIKIGDAGALKRVRFRPLSGTSPTLSITHYAVTNATHFVYGDSSEFTSSTALVTGWLEYEFTTNGTASSSFVYGELVEYQTGFRSLEQIDIYYGGELGRGIDGLYVKRNYGAKNPTITAGVEEDLPVYPDIFIDQPTNSTYTVFDIPINVSTTATDESSRYYSLNNTAYVLFTGNTTISGIGDGNYNLTVFINNTANNTNSTSVYFTIDTTAPIITISEPTNKTYASSNLSVNVSTTSSDEDSRYYSLNNAAYVWFTGNTTILVSDGSYNITIFMNDTANNTNTASVYFSVDTVYPDIYLDQPTNSTYTIFDIPINVSTTSSDESSRYYSINNTDYVQFTGNTTVTLGGGDYNLTVFLNDTANNTIYSSVYFHINYAPTQGTPILNSTGDNETADNLTAFNQSTADVEGADVKNIYNWYMNNKSIMVLNTPFEGGSLNGTDTGVDNGTKDYSPNKNNGTVYNAMFNSTGGYDGKGAYEFDGINNYIDFGNDSSFNFGATFSVSFWIKTNDTNTAGLGRYDEDNDIGWYINIGSSGDISGYVTDGTLGENTPPYITITDDKWYHVVFVSNNTRNRLYVDGSNYAISESYVGINETKVNMQSLNITVGDDKSGQPTLFNGTLDELIFWNRTLSFQQVQALYLNQTNIIVSQETVLGETWQSCITPNDGFEDGVEACSNNLTIIALPPDIYLDEPTNSSYSVANISINVSTTATDESSRYYSLNNTAYVLFTGNTTVIVGDGSYNLTIFINDTANNTNSTSVSFTVDTVYPDIYLDQPTNSTYTASNISVNVSTTSTDESGRYYSINDTAYVTFTGNTSIFVGDGGYNLTVFINDTTNNTISTSVAFAVDTNVIYGIEETHNALVSSASIQSFILNVTYNNHSIDNITSIMYYDDIFISISSTDVQGNKTKLSSTFTVPSSIAKINKSFYWNVTTNFFNGSTILYHYNYSQTLVPLSIYECDSTNQSLVMNFTLRDEINLTLQNGTFEAYFTVWDENISINSSLSVPTLTNSSFYLCMSPNNITRTVNAQIEYNGDGYDRRDYFFRSVTLNSSTGGNTSLETILYLLTDTEAVGTKFVVTDELENPLTEHYIYAQRKDISNNTFFNVAMGKTDSDGEAYIPLDFYDAWYKFIVYDSDNTLIKSTDETILQATPVLIKITPSTISDILTNYDNMDLSLSFDNGTKIFTFTYSDGSGAVRRMCLEVKKLSTTTDNRTVCSQCLTTSAGSISCGVGTEEGMYVAVVYGEQNPAKELLVAYYEYVTSLGDKLGVDGVVYAMLMFISVIFLFLFNPTSAIFATIIATIFIFLTGFASLPYLAVISIVCAGVVLLVVIRS